MPEPEADKAPRSRTFAIRLVATLLAVVLVGVAVFDADEPVGRPRAAPDRRTFRAPRRDRQDRQRPDAEGRPFLVYFGYTHCPDVVRPRLRGSPIFWKDGG